MGMDYQYAGSASYPRFDKEVKTLVELFGGCETDELKNRKENQTGIDHWFGYMSSADSKMEKYTFPKETNEILVKWFNNIYEKFNAEETQIVFDEIKKHSKEVNEISGQIYYELETLCEDGECWELE